jgi:hypothetical protein
MTISVPLTEFTLSYATVKFQPVVGSFGKRLTSSLPASVVDR